MGFGLKPLLPDSRDFTLGAIYGDRNIKLVPDYDFVVDKPLEISNQYYSDMCVAFAGAAVSSDQEKIALSPEYLFAKGKQIAGNPNSWGLDLRTICKALCQFGTIEKNDSPYNL